MSTSLISARLRISKSLLSLIVVLLASCPGVFSQQAGSHPPQIWLSEPQGLTVNHVSALAAPLRSAKTLPGDGTADPSGAAVVPVNLGQPISMVSADFDEDGVIDLVVGYKGAQGTSIVIHRGNLDAFAPQSDASFQAIGRGEFPSPFLTDAQVIGVPLSPDFIAAGNFAGHGHADIVLASRGGTQLYLLPGDGKGNFGAAQTLNLPAGITAMASGEFGHSNGYDTLLAAISSSPRSAALAVIRGTPQGLASAAALPLSAPATAFAFGDLDSDGAPDAAILAGGQALVLHSSSLLLEDAHLPGSALGLTVGAFIFDRVPGLQIALLMPNGSVLIGAHNDFDPRTYSTDEFAAIRKAVLEGGSHPLRPELFYRSNGWKIVETIPGAATFSAGQVPVLFRTRISSQGGDDVVALNSSSGQMTLISHPDLQPGDSTFLRAQISSRPYGSSVLSALPVRVNIDGRPGIVALHEGAIVPSVMMPLPDPTFTVNTTNDILNTAGNFCAKGTANKCSLRQALWEANHTAGTDTINIPAGTYTLTIAKVANDCTGQFGALYVNDSVNIVGAGQATTIIQAGTTSANGVDMVMAVNEDLGTPNCPVTNATASISNLTLKFGHNNGTHGNDGDGGCMEFDTGSSGNANLTLTSTTLTNCSTTKGNGGGIAIFNFTSPANGLVTFINSIVQNNSAVDTTAGVGAGGGGIWVSSDSRMSMSTSQVLNNNATQVNGTGKGIGGGIFTVGSTPNSRQTVIHSSTISGNKSAGFGGGIFNLVNLLVDQRTIISGNTAGTDGTNPIAAQQGGGLYDNTSSNGCPGACTDTVTLNKVTISGNTATGPGGGIYHGNNTGSGSLIINFSRLAGNTASSGSNLFEDHSVANVTNNWWGTNQPDNTIFNNSGTVTSDPFIVQTHNATPAKIRINQSTTLTGDMSKDNHGNGTALTGNLDEIAGLPITFDNAVLGTIPQTQPETLNASAQATATFNAGGTSGRGSANATVDQAVMGANSNFIASATEAGATATITTVGTHNFAANQTVIISGVGIAGYNGTFTILATPTPTTFTYTAPAGLAASSGGTAKVGIIILEPPQITKSFGAATIPINGTTTVTFSINNPNVVAINASFTDTLPTGLQVGSTPGVTNTCGGTVTAAAGSGSISFSNNLIPTGNCTITVNITGTVDNNYTNSVQILSTDAGNGNTSSANITVINPPHIVKAFGATAIPLNGTTSLTFTIDSNGNQILTQTRVGFTDTMPAGLVVATPGNPTTTCSGTVTASDGSSTISLTSVSIAANSSCTVSVTVQATTAGVKNNNVQVTSSNAGTGNTASASITVEGPPTISKAFGAASIPLNGTTSLTFTLTNPNTGTTLTGIAFSDTVPANLKMIGFGSAGDTCNGVTSPGSSTVNYSGISLAANSSCTLSVIVKGIATGDAVNTTSAITSTEGGTGTTSNTATLTVVAPPTISKAFGAATIPLNGTTTVTFTITNPAANTTAETGIAFSDTLTNGLQVASTPGVSNICGGTVTAAANTTSISLTGGSIATPGSTCTIVVNVTGTQSGTVTNTTGAVSSTEGGTGAASNTATLLVASPPTVTKAFGAARISLNAVTSLTINITNPNNNMVLTGLSFTDSLPAGLVVAIPNGLTNTCSGTATATAGSGSVSLSGGTLAVSASCTVSVNVQGTTAGDKNNSVAVNSTEGGASAPATATVTVVAPPTISKAFGAANITLNGTTTVTFTITNPNNPATPANGDLTGVSFSDTLPVSGGPASATLVVSGTPNVTNTCGGTVTATAGTGVISLTGGSVAHNASCTISVDVKGTVEGDANNTTGAISSTEGGTGAASNTATLKVIAPPTISKAFGAANIPLNGTTTVTFMITNPASNTSAENGIAFSDTLTNGLQVASTPGVSNTCGGTVTAAANSTSISLTGGSIATPGATCTIVVNVTGTQSGTVTNTTGAVSSTNGGTGAASNTATLSVASPATVTKVFGATKIPLNGTTSLTITITNPNTNVPLTGLSFTDSLPAGLVVATPNSLTNTCGGTATAIAGSGSVSLSGGTVAASASCAVSVNVQGTTAGTKNNSVTVSSTEGGASTPATATVTVVAPPTISKAFGAGSVPLNGTTTVTFTISNPNNPATPANGDLTGVSFSDTLPVSGGAGSATLVVSGTPNVTNTCGGTVTATAGSGVISLTGGSVAHNASCTISVDVKGTVEGDANNTTGAISSTNGGTGATSNTATLLVASPPTVTKAFGAANIPLNGTTTLTITITNPASNSSAENGITFSDTLTNGLQVASTPGVSNTCGGTVTAAANSTSISLTGGSIATPGNTCTLTVNVTGTQAGTVTNTTGAVSSTNGGSGNQATATITVVAPPSIT